MRMNYFVVGTNDMNASIEFYDALFERSGLNRVSPSDRMTYWLGEDFAFAAALPFDGRQATNGNGTMVGFSVGTAEAVRQLHERAIELGGTCEGAPGQRGPRFSAYVRDLDGNKLCFSD
ncbi:MULTISPECIES: VOC family protein [Hyphomonas]|uniref:Glyoxalase n=1 Tax=Hyphomonas adhaerens TaxID=81029 RepID=A0A3B9H203_9PROT|nr:VOC family protein [Hyphomonas adhaerens]MBB40696.1 glyoxalase [Hyphomonas sp.]HAE28678.1 glyoxalase [Hyphomonas adhaerens]|tara:strand:- start:1213 stop:1569 length:357 start_codon:yes stop_codon:yes gene_type:complete